MAEQLDISIDLNAIEDVIEFDIGGSTVTYDSDINELKCVNSVVQDGAGHIARTNLYYDQRRVSLRILLDKSVVELFVDRGIDAFVLQAGYPDNYGLTLTGVANISSLRISTLQSIWS